MKRRTFIAGASGVGAATIGGVVLLSGGAVAEISDHEFVGTTIHGESDDGSIDDVEAGATNVGFRYEGLNDPADYATVELQVVYDGHAETIDEASRDDLSGTSRDGVALGEELRGSVLEHPDLESSDFEAEGDGETVTTNVTLRLTVTVTTKGSDDVTGFSDANLEVVMQNLESDAGVGGEADGEVVTDFEQLGVSQTNPDAHVETDGVLKLFAAYGEDEYRFRVELDDPWADEDEDHANFGIGLDVEPETDTYQYQLNWSAERDFFHHVDATNLQEGLPDGIEGARAATDEGATFTFVIDRNVAPFDLPDDGDEYGFVANASYGGATHANVSTDPAHAWDSDQWDASTYFRSAVVEIS